jgi:hypothetical protein
MQAQTAGPPAPSEHRPNRATATVAVHEGQVRQVRTTTMHDIEGEMAGTGPRFADSSGTIGAVRGEGRGPHADLTA